ncbi:MAG TPA: LysR family transcriptional regulator [Polyangia bacterium]|nr:LysR family transcriptional regulator [Polyangia bacterium]
MDVESLRCFEAAATTLSFRAAAARVHLSPAAFSDRIRRLEEDLGVSVLRRTTRQVALTDAGQRLLPLVRETLAGVERVRAAARDKGRPAPFELIIGTRYELGISWLCPALSALERHRPERTIHLFNADSPDLLRRLERGELDAAITSTRLNSPRLAYAALHAEDYAFVSATRCLRGREDARSLTLVDVSGDLPLFRYFLDAQANAEPWPFARIEFMGGIGNIRLRLLEGGGRVAVLPHYFVARDVAAGRLVTLLPRLRPRSDTFRLVWRAGHPRENELVALAAELRARPLR